MNLIRMTAFMLTWVSSTQTFMLPAPLYYIANGQVWRMTADCNQQIQMTHEAAPVESFDVSPVDSSLVYVTRNVLIHTDRDGLSRHELITGTDLQDNHDDLAAMNDRRRIAEKIASPVWSPDGKRIAFIQNGLNIMDFLSRAIVSEHPNDAILESEEVMNRLVIASVESWSPDSRYLALMTYRYTLKSRYQQNFSIKTIGGSLIELASGVGFTSQWIDQGNALLLADASTGGACSLVRYGVAERRTVCIGEDIPARRCFFYSHPFQSASGDYFALIGQSANPSLLPESFTLSKLRKDGFGRVDVRTDRIDLRSALWAPDGSGLIIVTRAPSKDRSADLMRWIPIDGQPTVTLPVCGASSLRWGH